ncbi:hypothetical protein AAG906_004970 [Vitis piasezkii]
MVEVNKLKSLLSKEFDMKDLGATKKIIGMEIHRDRASRRLWLSQYSYVKRVLEMFNMDDAKPVSTHLANHFRLSTNQCPKIDDEVKDMSKVLYASAVGCLMYAMVCTRLDLACVVSVSDPSVRGYVDADYAGDLDDRRSTTSYVFTLGGGLICWKFMIQSLISQSIVPGGVISYVSCLFKGRVNIRQGGDCCSIWLILEIVVGKQKVGGCGGQRPPRYGSRVFLEFHS